MLNPLDLFPCSWYFMLEAEHSWNNSEMEKLWFDLPVKIEINRLQVEHYKNCVFLFLVSRPKMAELAIEMEKLTFKLWDLKKGRCHIRVVDTGHSPKLRSKVLKSDHKKNNSRWTKDTIVKYRDHKEHNKMVVHMFWLTLSIKSENTNQLKTWIESTFHPLPHEKIPLPQEVFPPQNPSSRGHGRICPAHPPLPRPRWAARRRKPGRSRLPGAAVFCLGSRGPRAQSPQAEPNGTEGEKKSEKIWAPQKWKSWNMWTFQLLTRLTEHCCFEMFWGHGIALKKQLPLVFDSSPRWLGWTRTYSNSRKYIRLKLGHLTILNALDLFLCSWYFMLEAEHSWNNSEMEKLWFDLPVKIEMNCLRVEHYKNCVSLFLVSRPKMAELAIEMEKLTFKLSYLQKGRCHIRVVDTGHFPKLRSKVRP